MEKVKNPFQSEFKGGTVFEIVYFYRWVLAESIEINLATKIEERHFTLNIESKWISIFLILLILIRVTVTLSGYYIWDDSYMFIRYADNIINFHHISWNPGDVGTYGLTSVLYLLIVLPIRLIVGDNFVVIGLSASIICGVAFIALMYFLLQKNLLPDKNEYIYINVVLSILLTSNLIYHFTTGMDTLFDLTFVTVYLIVLNQYNRYKTLKLMITTGILGGLAFFVRPVTYF